MPSGTSRRIARQSFIDHPAIFGSVNDVLHACCGFWPEASIDEDFAALEEEEKIRPPASTGTWPRENRILLIDPYQSIQPLLDRPPVQTDGLTTCGFCPQTAKDLR